MPDVVVQFFYVSVWAYRYAGTNIVQALARNYSKNAWAVKFSTVLHVAIIYVSNLYFRNN